MAPNIVVRLHYYNQNSAKRNFYDCTQKDDYLSYVDKGIKLNSEIDYIDYAGAKEKSSGVFNHDGLVSKSDMKNLREMLRNTKSCIWDMVISFTKEFGDKNIYDIDQAQNLIAKVFPKLLKQTGLNKENIVWYAGLHTNTDNRHLHISFFEKEPQRYNQKNKTLNYHFGKLKIEAVNSFKMEIEKHFLSPIESIKRVRRQMTESAKSAISDYSGYNKSLKSLIKEIYEKIPFEGRVAYESDNMNECRPVIDKMTTCILNNGSEREAYRSTIAELSLRDKELSNLYQVYNVKTSANNLLTEKFIKDIYRRMGNVIIKEILKIRKSELLKMKELRHAKALQKLRQDSLLYLFDKTLKIACEAEREAAECFDEYQKKLEIAELDRKMEEREMS